MHYKFEDPKVVIRSRKSKKGIDNTITEGKSSKRKTRIYQTLHRKINFEKNEFHQDIGVILGVTRVTLVKKSTNNAELL